MKLSIAEFMKTGVLGSVRLGLAKGEVVNSLGIPSAKSERPAGIEIHEFGPINIWFEHDVVVIFGIYVLSELALPQNLEWLDLAPSTATTSEQIIALLRNNHIQHELIQRRIGLTVKTAGGVLVALNEKSLMSIVRVDTESPRGKGVLNVLTD